MDGISNSTTGINMQQNPAEMFKTKMEADSINKALKTDGKEPVKEMGKEQFLKLLITELQHQDPTSPMQDREFIAQMAQFSSLEQMLSLNTGMKKLIDNNAFQSSFNMLGMKVDIESARNIDEQGNSHIVSGIVESVSKKGEDVVVRVNGEEYLSSEIVRVAR